jgi:hypothetical protein
VGTDNSMSKYLEDTMNLHRFYKALVKKKELKSNAERSFINATRDNANVAQVSVIQKPTASFFSFFFEQKY